VQVIGLRLYDALKKTDQFMVQLSRIITAAAIGVQMVVMFLGVVFRYFFKAPLVWSDELSTYLLVFVTFFGSYVALKDKALANLELVVNKLSGKARKYVVLAANVAVMLFLGLIAYFGVILCLAPAVLNTVSPSMELPTVIFYAVLPVSGVMMVVHMLLVIHDDFLRNDSDTDGNTKHGKGDYQCL
jgi:TRAP-type C4-dicarboxylate transport system permease small subunit